MTAQERRHARLMALGLVAASALGLAVLPLGTDGALVLPLSLGAGIVALWHLRPRRMRKAPGDESRGA